ncbi:1-acyl-sn-glycerol-3-phosphate acyltransferase [Arthrobacter sp. V4I6]|uniref:lysophospholipid acyltransferase family protein n=1 Tax=unclassified Arthrobacter TaxID=235627 RepID=UPI0027858BEF|nr:MULTISPECIES: lysophospholipid acyltransferase family protein [unclassified Arthrobacter]MDQ0821799.1 1-acyl-sn-glycerol-3-phosphate acyltransferase [Arthrobacter sp. V1I7]MDQ0856064.1 1-acyl-sn-glycerol-3-phosphate acyltransferase [Arthrobacter sp. V4I6]
MTEPQPALPGAWTTSWSRPVGWLLDHVVYRTSVTGRANVPASGPVIFAGNHISFLDGPVMFGAAPRPMHILVKKELFTGFLGRVLTASGQLSVDRAGDRAALHKARRVLEAGRCVGILPEGTRGSGEASAINNGVAWLALSAGATVVPVAILGTRISGEDLDAVPRPRRQLHVSFGGALNVSRRPGETGRVSMDRAGTEIRAALARHVQDSITGSGQPLPDADSPQERHEAVAGTPADHHLRNVQ